jgi:hypothetical protein
MGEQRGLRDAMRQQVDELEATTRQLAGPNAGETETAWGTIIDDLNEIRHALGGLDATAADPAEADQDTDTQAIMDRG